MKCEVEFLAVGEGEKAGDCIVVRYGDEHTYSLMVVDGGTLETGDELVQHLRKQFSGVGVIEHVVLTHADGDHASGLRKLFGQFQVRNLWLHVPWMMAAQAKHLFSDKTVTTETLARRIRDEYDILSELVTLAQTYGTAIHQPFEGAKIGPFVVLNPSAYVYTHLLPQFERTPEPDQAALEAAGMWLGKARRKSFLRRAIENVTWTFETYQFETLRDRQYTSASNESSVVLYADCGEARILLTGDAGIEALTWAADAADRYGLELRNFQFVQIPHHGSRNNVGPTVLNRLIGPITPEMLPRTFFAFASAPKDSPKHPRRVVLNAFHRRGAMVTTTQDGNKVFWGGFAPRADYGPVSAIPLSTSVEQYD